MKILCKSSKSVLLTQILTILLLIFLVTTLFFIPVIGSWYAAVPHATALRPTNGADAEIALNITLYAAEIPALTAAVSVWLLLFRHADLYLFQHIHACFSGNCPCSGVYGTYPPCAEKRFLAGR